METPPLNPSLPGIRLIQSWVRDEIPLSLELADGLRLEGACFGRTRNSLPWNGLDRVNLY